MGGSLRRSFGVLLSLLLTFPVGVAQAAAPGNAQNAPPNTGINLNLSSSQATTTAGHLASSKPISITVGGASQSVTAASLLTPAERLAVYQVFSTGQQSLQLSASGTATGGSFTIGPKFSQFVSTLVIPAGVTAIDNFGSASTFSLSGNLTNSGNFIVVSSNPKVTTATISANNIFNQQGALLTSVLPASGFPGVGSAVSALNLQLTAVNNVINAGTISSSGSLTVSAGGSIANALSSGASGPNPSMQAMNAVNLQAPSVVNQGLIASQAGNVNAATASLTNSGTLQALSGSITVQNPADSMLSVNNTQGTITAGNQIQFETLASTSDAEASLSVSGGTLSAGDVSFTSPNGQIAVQADQIDGVVNLSGESAEVGTQEGNLVFGQVNLSGDPIFYTHGGNLDLSSLFTNSSTFSTNGQDFVALATGNIVASTAPSNAAINASSTHGNGGEITLAAGVNFTVTGSSSPFAGGTGQIACSNCTGSFSITGPSSSGGNVNLPTVGLVTNGNTVNIQANPGPGNVTGSVSVRSVQTSGSNSNITISAAQLDLGPLSTISAGSSSLVSITSPAGSSLTIQSPAGSSATIAAGGGNLGLTPDGLLNTTTTGSVNISPAFGQSLNFIDSDPTGAHQTTLNLNGGTGSGVLISAATTSSGNTTMTVGSGVTLSANSAPMAIVFTEGNGTLVDNGTIASNAPNTNLFSYGNAQFTPNSFQSPLAIESLGGSLTLSATNSSPGEIIATTVPNSIPMLVGGKISYGFTSIDIETAGGLVDFKSSYTFGTNPAAETDIVSNNGSISLENNVTLTENGGTSSPGPSISLNAPQINFGANTAVVVTPCPTCQSFQNAYWLGGFVLFANAYQNTNGGPLVITLPSGSNVTVSGPYISFLSQAPQNSPPFNGTTQTLTDEQPTIFQSSGSGSTTLTANGSATFLYNGSTVPAASLVPALIVGESLVNITVGAGVKIQSNGPVILETPVLNLGANACVTSNAPADAPYGVIVENGGYGSTTCAGCNSPLQVNLTGSTATLAAPNGNSIWLVNADELGNFGNAPGLSVLFASSSPGGSTLNLNGGNAGYVLIYANGAGAGVSIGNSVTLNTDSSITIVGPTISFGANSGVVSSAPSGSSPLGFTPISLFSGLSFFSPALPSSLVINLPSNSSVNLSGGGVFISSQDPFAAVTPAEPVTIQTASGSGSTTLNLNTGSTGTFGTSSLGSTTIGNGVTLAFNGSATVTTPQLNLGKLSALTGSGNTSTIAITSPGGSDLTIQSPASSSASIEAGGGNLGLTPAGLLDTTTTGSINITPAFGQSLNFVDSISAVNQPTTLNLNGGTGSGVLISAATTSSGNTTMTVGSGVTLLATTAPMAMAFTEGNGTLVDNGTITSNAPNTNLFVYGNAQLDPQGYKSMLTIQSLSGNLTLNTSNGRPGQISQNTNPVIFQAAQDGVTDLLVMTGGNGSIDFKSSYTFGTQPVTETTVFSNNGSITLENNATLTVTGGSSSPIASLNLLAPNINFGNNTSIVVTPCPTCQSTFNPLGWYGGFVYINNAYQNTNGAGPMVITLPSNSSVAISAPYVDITPQDIWDTPGETGSPTITDEQALTFRSSGSGSTTLNINGYSLVNVNGSPVPAADLYPTLYINEAFPGLTIGAGVRIVSNGPVLIQNPTLTLGANASLTSTAPASAPYGIVVVNGGYLTTTCTGCDGPLQINLTGSVATLAAPNGNSIWFTNADEFFNFGNAPGQSIDFASSAPGSSTLNLNANGVTLIYANGAGASVNIGNSLTLASTGSIFVVGPTISFGANSALVSSGSSSSFPAITIQSTSSFWNGFSAPVPPSPLVIELPNNSSANITGATIYISSQDLNLPGTTPESVTFQPNGSGISTLGLNGQTFISTSGSGSVTIDPRVTLLGNNRVTVTTTQLNIDSQAELSAPIVAINSPNSTSTLSIANAGILNSGTMLSATSTLSINLSGSGTLSTVSGAHLNSFAASVNVSRAQSGQVGGYAATTFSADALNSGLSVGSITTKNGSMTLVARQRPAPLWTAVPTSRPPMAP